MYEAFTLNPFGFSMTCIKPNTSESIPYLTRLNVATHVLVWLCDFDHDCAFAGERAAAFDRVVGSFESFNREHSPVFDNDGLPDIEPRNFLGDVPGKIDIFLLRTRQLRSGDQTFCS